MHLLKLLLLAILSIIVPALKLTAAPDTVNPMVTDSVSLDDYRRIWGSPSGSFYFLKHSGFEVRQYASNKSISQSLGPNQKLISSDNGNYFAILVYNSFSPTALHVNEIRLFTCDGQMVWSKRDPGCSSFILSDGEPVAVGIAGAEGFPQSELIFFGPTGDEVGHADIDNFSNGRFCEGGEYFFAVSGGKGLIKYTTSGREEFQYPDCHRYSVGRHGDLVVALRDSALAIYRGHQLQASWAVPGLSVREVRISPDNHLAAILQTQQLQLLDLDSMRVLWQYSLPDSDYQFFHFDTDSGFTYFACSTNNSVASPERRNTLGQVFLLDSSGAPVWRTETSYEDWSVKYPEVKIDLRARILTLLTAERFEVYSF